VADLKLSIDDSRPFPSTRMAYAFLLGAASTSWPCARARRAGWL